ncbi:CRT (chloroquine-resistance transporter)-like transporter, putative [Medicago truncatula]|uniref:CRT (Chloroquine-resistance transporter)-like transporter, putative n=1 Tax=Medicago truncatula TaxID=3880 RepID=A0A072UR97_MEDTR|nr:CRT (chloroquine-resistance transporter)-like transporter, putative [Medicago truncatula]
MASFCRRCPDAGAIILPAGVTLRRSEMTAGDYGIRYGYSPRKTRLLRMKFTVVVAAGDGGSRRIMEKVGPCNYAVEDGSVGNDDVAGRSGNKAAEVAVAAAATVVMGVGNRVLYKLALVPLKQYPFFLAQLSTFGYVIVYFGIMYIRHRAGIVTDEMLSLPKTPFVVIGLLEALAAATGMAAGAILSGASIPILSQTFLVWQILLSIIFLGRRYKVNHLLGCFLVTIGVVVTVASGPDAGNSLKDGGLFWSLLMIVSFLLQAADTVLKELIFLDANKKLKGGSVDLFVVNSYGSAFQVYDQCRHYSYAFFSHSCQNYGVSPSVNYQTTSKMVQLAS